MLSVQIGDDLNVFRRLNRQAFRERLNSLFKIGNLAADRGAFLAAYNIGSSDADYNGDGIVNLTDRRSFLSDWRAAKDSK